MARKVYLTNADRELLKPKLIKFHRMNPSFSKTELAKRFEVSYMTVKNWITFDDKFRQGSETSQEDKDVPTV